MVEQVARRRKGFLATLFPKCVCLGCLEDSRIPTSHAQVCHPHCNIIFQVCDCVYIFSCFTSNPGSRKLCLPMLLSTFSHFSGIHLAANMFVLDSFMAPAVHLLGKEQFLGVYLTSGVFTSLASYVHKVRFSAANDDLAIWNIFL